MTANREKELHDEIRKEGIEEKPEELSCLKRRPPICTIPLT